MDEARMGRAFSVHTFAGFLGGAVAPAIMAALVATIGGLGALMVAGAVGPAVALLMIAMNLPDASAADRKANGGDAPKQNIITPAIIMLTIFFMLLGLSNAGIGNFGIVATGFNFSGILAPLLFGWIMDQNLPHWVFGASVVFMVLTVLLALVTDRKSQAAAAAPDARQLDQG